MVLKYEKYDLVIIGGGPAGTPVAMEYATVEPKKRILLVDKKGELGGECLFDGCIPSKILEISGKHYRYLNKLYELGIDIENENPKIIWDKIVEKKNRILNKRTKAAKENLFAFGNIELIKGEASFESKNTIKIVQDEDVSNVIEFEKAVIATGSRTFIPPFRGNGVEKAWTNKEFFDKMELPKTITIIGDGPIGIELAQILSTLNTKVNLIGNQEGILPMVDKKYSDILLNKIKNDKNINLILNSDVEEINFNEELNKFQIKYLNKYSNQIEEVDSEKTLIATGRRPNIETLDLNKGGIEYERKGVVVNEFLQTSNKNVYSAGDVALGFPQFAHTSSYGAHIITQNLFFGKNKFKVNFDKNSWVLFSDPNIVSVGISEKMAIERKIDYIVGEYDYSIDAKAQIEDEDFGYLKFIVDRKTLRIIGITIITNEANAISGEASVIVSNNLTLKDLVNTIQSHPTLNESFSFLAKEMMSKMIKEKIKKPLFKTGIFTKKI